MVSEKTKKWFGWILIAMGIMVLTPPFIFDVVDIPLYLFFGFLFGLNGVAVEAAKRLVTNINPFFWDFSSLSALGAYKQQFIIVTILVYLTGFLFLIIGSKLASKKAERYLNEIKYKFRRFFA